MSKYVIIALAFIAGYVVSCYFPQAGTAVGLPS